MRLFHRAVNVDDDAGLTIDEWDSNVCLEVVANSLAVMAAHGSPSKASGVDSLDFTEVVK